jgi:hypothetical protein
MSLKACKGSGRQAKRVRLDSRVRRGFRVRRGSGCGVALRVRRGSRVQRGFRVRRGSGCGVARRVRRGSVGIVCRLAVRQARVRLSAQYRRLFSY